MSTQTEIKQIELRHPINHCPATAVQTAYYFENGRCAGLVLLFPDGHTASLTYAEIRELQKGEGDDS